MTTKILQNPSNHCKLLQNFIETLELFIFSTIAVLISSQLLFPFTFFFLSFRLNSKLFFVFVSLNTTLQVK